MFSKKRIEVKDLMFTFEQEDYRESFRYVFDKETRLKMRFKNKDVSILDISAGGLAFINNGFSKYDADQVTLNLSMPNFTKDPIMKVRLRILNITPHNICNSIFENCTIEEYELVHKFVLEMQKKDLNAS